jgi:hypothetical protein
MRIEADTLNIDADIQRQTEMPYAVPQNAAQQFVSRVSMCQNRSGVNVAQGVKPLNPIGCSNHPGQFRNICRDVDRLNV